LSVEDYEAYKASASAQILRETAVCCALKTAFYDKLRILNELVIFVGS
jgi:hypothetical protein